MKRTITLVAAFLFIGTNVHASVVAETGCAVVVQKVSDSELVVEEVVIPSMPDGYDEESYTFRDVGECKDELSSGNIRPGTQILVDESNLEIVKRMSEIFVLPVSHFSGANSPSGPVAGGYMYEYSRAYEYNSELSEMVEDDLPERVDNESDSEKRSLQTRLISVLQQLISLLTLQ